MTFLFGLWFGVATYQTPRPSYPYYDTQKPAAAMERADAS